MATKNVPNQLGDKRQRHLTQQQHHLLLKDEEFHLQRAKKNWATKGDRNTSFFHQAITKRNRKNRITYLQNPNGTHSTTPQQLADTLLNYFKHIFASDNNISVSSMMPANDEAVTTPNSLYAGHDQQPQAWVPASSIEHDPPSPSDDPQQSYTNSTPDIHELHSIIKKMRSNASPGPDGLNAAFFKTAWPWISQDVHKVVTDFYSTAFLQPELNQTFITLIPKKMHPVLPQDFRPISLCNVIYKLISKSLADRLKPQLPNYIDHSQATFIENRHISSNIVITQEIVHSFSLKS